MSISKEELEKLLHQYDDEYYNQDNPSISDSEYDNLKDSYIKLYGEYNYVPGDVKEGLKKFKHTVNVSSLAKVKINEIDKLKEEIHRLWPCIIQDKLDGLTLVSYPNNDVTRGNGLEGEVVTNKTNNIKGMGNRENYIIREEVVMLISDFERINQERIANGEVPFKNARNAAAGMLRQLDNNKVQGLTAIAYNILSEEEKNDSYNQILTLQKLGWNTVNTYIPKNEEEALNYILTYEDKYRNKLDYDIDGLVIKHNGNKKFGYTGHHPKGAVAVKFNPKGEWTTVNRIIPQVGRTGKITPVAEFNPIDIEGSTINRATLHNYQIVNTLGLNTLLYSEDKKSLTRIKVVKSNDVIPAIVEVDNSAINESCYTEQIYEPKICPVCGSELSKVNNQLYCNNFSCSSKILNRLIHMAQKEAFNIEGLSEETSKKLIAYYKHSITTTINELNIKSQYDESYDYYLFLKNKLKYLHPSFIYSLSLKDIENLPGFAEKSAKKLYNEIRNSLNISFDRFLYGCGIPLIGRKVAKDIAEFYYQKSDNELQAFLEDYDNNFKDLKTLKGIGSEIIKSLTNNILTMLDPFGDFDFNITDCIPNKKADNQLTFVITGEFDIPRKQIKELIESNGHKVTGSVSKKTNYLLAAPGEESTSKFTKAKNLNIPIINSLKELEEVL